MSLIPFFDNFSVYPHRSGQHFWDVFDWPPVLSHQNFGRDLTAFDDFFGQRVRSLDSLGRSEVTNDDDKFEIKLDCNQFKPEELTVKTVNNEVLISGKHEERNESDGSKSWVSRQFSRKYTLPLGCEAQEVQSSLEPNGMLRITAPKHELPELMDKQRDVPIAVQNGNKRQAIRGRK